MGDYEVKRGGTAKLDHVDGELRVGNKAKIESAQGNRVVVAKGAYFEGNCEINCDFECDSLQVRHGGTLRVAGDLFVHNTLDVIHSIDVKGKIKAREIDVGGRIHSNSIECDNLIRVGGKLDVQESLAAKSLDVGGQASTRGQVKLEDLTVGGVAEIGGGTISGRIRVGGKFQSSGPLEFGDIEVVGKIILPSNCKGRKISTFGKLSSEGDLECDELMLKGRAEIGGNCKTRKIESSGKFNVGGSTAASGEVASWGQTEIEGEFNGTDLRIGGYFKARRIVSSNEIEVLGQVETREGLKGGTIFVRSGSKYTGVIVGDKVDVGKSYDVVSNWGTTFAGQTAILRLIGKETKVGDIYAKEVHLGKAARCGKVFADVVEFEEGCIAEEITYTKEVRGPIEKVFLNRPFPRKVATLPTSPL